MKNLLITLALFAALLSVQTDIIASFGGHPSLGGLSRAFGAPPANVR